MVILSVDTYWQNIVIGAIIILAVIVDTLRRRKMLTGGVQKAQPQKKQSRARGEQNG